jgi:LysR family glycine cleavage system transcriptional activator
MSRRLPPLNALRAFEAAARHLSFTKAAAELHVTQAAISHQVRALEDHLGVALFKRRNKAVILTESGQLCLPGIREGFDRLAEAIERIRAPDAANLLSVTTTPSFAAKWLVPRLNRFRLTHPEIEVRIDASIHVIDLERERFDLAIRYGGGSYPGLRSELLIEVAVSPVCSPRLLKGKRALKTPGDLKHHTLLHTDWIDRDEEGLDWGMWLLAAGVTDVDWTRGPQFNDQTVAIQAAIEGHGVALGRSGLVDADIAAGRLVRPFRLSVTGRLSYYLVYPEVALRHAKVIAFRDWARGEVRRPGMTGTD